MPWVYLLLAGVFEIAWAVSLKYAQGFTRAVPSAVVIVTGFASFYLLGVAAARIPIGTAYAIWTGIGAVGTAILGMILFGEPRNALRLVSMVLVIAGIAGLKLFSK